MGRTSHCQTPMDLPRLQPSVPHLMLALCLGTALSQPGAETN